MSTAPGLFLLTSGIGYLVGTIPFGLLIGKTVFGKDLRLEGSGNIGATNTARVLGAKWGIICLILDALKGALPVILAGILAGQSTNQLHAQVCAAIGAVCGHMFPVWLKFRGGKGVATGLGAALAISPLATGITVAVFAIVFAITRTVSIGSIVAAIAFAGIQLWLLRPNPFTASTWSLAAFSLFVPALIVARHTSNISRILRGKEGRFGTATARTETGDKLEQSSSAQSETEEPGTV